ncbi:MAG TPA: Uma2 family endonuclease [Lacipirellulaceae bacterium]|jgi:Uma2 family endonuclease|nr:Uma2 family endonuclease [Lacipirellulaceae bacterium]
MSTVANFTLEQYERMVEAGAFDGHLRQHVEFIRGEIREMNPIGTFHAQTVGDLTDWSYDVIPRKEIAVRVQTTLRIPLHNSAPEPDIVWVRRRSYAQKHPEPSDVLLLIEVAESSLADDRGEKLELYALCGIQDYWIANLIDRTFEVYRKPVRTTYSYMQTFSAGDILSPVAVPVARLAIDNIFPN